MNATITTPTQPRTGPATARPPTQSPGRQLATLSLALLRSFFRDRVALLFTFVFPLMFLAVFGLLFRSGSDPTSIGVVGAGPVIDALPAEVFAAQRFDSLDAAVAKVRSGDLPAVVAQRGDTVLLRYAASDQVASATIRGIIGAAIARANVDATGQRPRFNADFQQVEAADTRPIQYLTPASFRGGLPPPRSSEPPSPWSPGAASNCCAASGCRPHRHGQWSAPVSASAWSPPWHRPRCSSGWR
jgi:ABC-2 type transport system permease protein